MTRIELRASFSLASIFALRMLGLFLILPVFAVHARGLPGGDNPTLVGLALAGAYGLTQAVLHIPYGMASDRLGRKPVILFGLVIFALGSVVAALAHDVLWIAIGRAIQGAGAISAAVMALNADLTREEHRTKAMAVIGASIGLTFALSLVLGPLLYRSIGVPGIFGLTASLAIGAMWVVIFVVPAPAPIEFKGGPGPRVPYALVLANTDLLRLNFGVFVLHAVQVAMFAVVPQLLVDRAGFALSRHWQIYLPVVLGSFVLMAPAIMQAERRGAVKPLLMGALVCLLAVQVLLVPAQDSFAGLVALLFLFFVAFNVLEASLPSLVSRIAPAGARGAALGTYNTMQSLGLATGGAAGTWLYHQAGANAVFHAAAAMVLCWLLTSFRLQVPPRTTLYTFDLGVDVDAQSLASRLLDLPGVREARVVEAERKAYLKVLPDRWDERSVRRLIGGET